MLSKQGLFSLLFIFVLLFFPSLAVAQAPAEIEEPPVPLLISNEETEISKGPHFFGGDSVLVSDVLAGDVYVAGSNVRLDGAVTGDVLVAGGQVVITGDVSQDIRVLGGTVMIAGTVNGSVTAVGGTITLAPSSEILGSVVMAGGNVMLDGDIGGNLVAYAGNVTTSGTVDGDTKIGVGTAVLLPTTTIGGSLTIETEDPESVQDEASVSGTRDVVVKTFDNSKMQAEKLNMEAVTGVSKFFTFFMGLVAGLVLLYFFPKTSQAVSKTVLSKPLASLGWGIVYLIIAPVVSIFLLTTILGIPLGILLLLTYIADLMVSLWVAGYAMGLYLAGRFKFSWLSSSYAQFVLGLAVITILSVVPIFGGVLYLASVLFGMGALWMWGKDILLSRKN